MNDDAALAFGILSGIGVLVLCFAAADHISRANTIEIRTPEFSIISEKRRLIN